MTKKEKTKLLFSTEGVGGGGICRRKTITTSLVKNLISINAYRFLPGREESDVFVFHRG